jgi:alpha-beta hydrolase superfamily lysophospholipase
MTTEGTFNGVSEAELFYRVFQPKGVPKAVIILVHGHGDHSAGLYNLTRSLVEHDYAAYAFDLRGHGRSSGIKDLFGHGMNTEVI